MRYNSIISRLVLLLTVYSFAIQASAQDSQDTLNVLFVGNSYTYVENLPHLVSILSEDTPTKLITRKSTVGGARWSEHWHGQRGLNTKEMIENGDFDIVVLQNHSMSAIETPDSLMKYGGLLCDFIKEHGAQPYLYVTWAREKVPQMQGDINLVYLKAAKVNDAIPVPVGDAWALALDYRPRINLYSGDGSHAAELGTYLTAAVFVKKISGSLPEKMGGSCMITDERGESVVLMYVDPLDALFMKEVAEEAVNKNTKGHCN